MKKFDFFQNLKKAGVVVVVRGQDDLMALKTIEACYKGGINNIEITFTVPKAHLIIEKVSKEFDSTDAVIGAGTVLDAETARIAMLSGAQFIVAPSINESTIKCCNRYNIPVIPGISSTTEAVMALELGCSVLKLFPGNVFKPDGLKAIKGPLPQVELMPTGGVSYENVEDWFKAGAFVVGAGSNITDGANKNNYKLVEDKAREFKEKVDRILKG